jgi:hypothetical protein
MKTRNWKIYTLTISLAFCLTLHVVNCYGELNSYMDIGWPNQPSQIIMGPSELIGSQGAYSYNAQQISGRELTPYNLWSGTLQQNIGQRFQAGLAMRNISLYPAPQLGYMMKAIQAITSHYDPSDFPGTVSPVQITSTTFFDINGQSASYNLFQTLPSFYKFTQHPGRTIIGRSVPRPFSWTEGPNINGWLAGYSGITSTQNSYMEGYMWSDFSELYRGMGADIGY